MVLVCLSLPLQAEEESIRGRFCTRDPGATAIVERCRNVEGAEFEIDPEPTDRTWIWHSRDQTIMALGTVRAGADVVELPEESFSISLEVDGSSDRGWPQTTTIAIGPPGDPDFWKVEVSNVSIVRLREIFLPDGSWSVGLKAERHAPATLEPARLLEESADYGVVELDPLPQIRGTVIDREGEGLATAMVLAEDDTLLTISEYGGSVFYEAPCELDRESCLLPEWFRVEHPGTAPAWYHVNHRDRDLDFGVLKLAPGGTLTLEIDRTLVPNDTLTVEILDDPRPIPSLPYYPLVSTTKLHEGEELVVFDNLPEGLLRLVIRGEHSGEYLSHYFPIRSEEIVDREIRIVPRFLVFEILDENQKPAPGATVQITQRARPGHVSSTAPSNEAGKAKITLWEGGDHIARLVHPFWRGGTRIPGYVDRGELRIPVGSATGYGRVLDEETAEPVPGATVLISNEFYEGDSAWSTLTDESGYYEIDTLMGAHMHRVQVIAPSYLDGFTRGFVSPEGKTFEEVHLEVGLPYTITVNWETGEPVVGAAMVGHGSSIFGETRYTDETGRIYLRSRVPDLPSPFWIVPHEGSFSHGEVYTEQDIRVTVPRPSGTVTLQLEDQNEDPIDFAQVFFTYDNLPIPTDALRQAIELMQGKTFGSGAATRFTIEGLAPGLYHFSAVQSFQEIERRLPAPTTLVPVNVSDTKEKLTVLRATEECTWRSSREICRLVIEPRASR